MIFLIGGQKGGTGKTTVAINLVAQLVNMGKKAILIDADRQSSATHWADYREEDSTLMPIRCIQKFDNIKGTAIEMSELYDYVIIDTAGRDSREMRTGMFAADAVILPFRATQFDLLTLEHVQGVLEEIRDVNPSLEAHALLTQTSTNFRATDFKEAQDIFTDFPDVSLMNSVIKHRMIYQNSLAEGRAVTEMRRTGSSGASANREIKKLTQEVLSWH
ncbi:AAA family ATPase (plasmid) [Methylomarinum sp. Ch1-1]|uniref:AAA family ATPase n=1 Tax=Methylomarinum roseum TaxID=3067653 RepID=A0AAU7P053_9GAMM